jgi:hypothetical protein
MNPMPAPDGIASERTLEVPHPLSKFGDSDFKDGPHANLILRFIHDWVFQPPRSERFKAAVYFLSRAGNSSPLVLSPDCPYAIKALKMSSRSAGYES